ncbi:high-affinity Zn(2+) transporter zrt1 [Mortierella claussenii]|nr:high-affinity Zn(2+) transporter zrt1 [Mortierella claussenii]
MMPTAMSNLSSPCLGRLFSENYTALGGLIILSSSLAMHWIEFMVMEHTQHRIQKVAEKMNCDNQAEERGKRESKLDSRDSMDFGGLGATGVATGPCPGHTVTILDQAVSRRSSWSSVSSYVLDHVSQETEQASDPDFTTALQSTSKLIQPLDPSLVNSCDARPNMAPIVSYGSISSSTSSDAIQNRAKPPNRHHHHLQEVAHSHAHSLQLLDHSQRRISTYILEAGVAAHSIIIGVTLGVSSGAEFMSLLVALVFYQFFEGFALGVRIADLELDKTYTHFMLALIFSLTTPLGAVIAIGISNSYNSMSAMAILMEGTFDAISAGILLYMGYVNLLAVEFNQNGEIRKENNSVKSMFFLALWAGAAAMAVIGLFA